METTEKIDNTPISTNQNHINRRAFLKKCAGCTACLTLMPISGTIASTLKTPPVDDAKKVFLKKGTCSQTFFYLLNREFDNIDEYHERAIDPLAGGLMEKGYQCGMLWGASMAVGKESFKKYGYQDFAISQAIIATQHLIESFVKKTNTADCREITNIDLSKKFSKLKLIFTSAGDCLRLTDKWAPKAIEASKKGLEEQAELPERAMSCSTEVAKAMGASDEEIITVSGLAGGLGLSGNACGALSTAIWINSLRWCWENPGKSGYSNPKSKEIVNIFEEETNGEYLCTKISENQFDSIEQHTEFIKNGGCERLINILADAASV